MGPSKHTSLHVAPRPDLIGLADIAAAALTAAVTAFLDHIITEAVCGQEKICTHCVRSSTSLIKSSTVFELRLSLAACLVKQSNASWRSPSNLCAHT